jgi:hypothetical protein
VKKIALLEECLRTHEAQSERYTARVTTNEHTQQLKPADVFPWIEEDSRSGFPVKYLRPGFYSQEDALSLALAALQ